MAICLVATIVIVSADDKQAKFDKLQKSLREAKLYYENALAQLENSSRDEIIAGIDTAIDLNEQWVIDLSAYNGLGPDSPTYDDHIASLNQAFDEAKKDFKEDIKDLDDGALRQRVTDELNNLILGIDSMSFNLGISG